MAIMVTTAATLACHIQRLAHWFSCLHNVYSLATPKRCRAHFRSIDDYDTCCWCLHWVWQHKHSTCREVLNSALELPPDGQRKTWIRVPMLAKFPVKSTQNFNIIISMHHSLLNVGNPWLVFIKGYSLSWANLERIQMLILKILQYILNALEGCWRLSVCVCVWAINQAWCLNLTCCNRYLFHCQSPSR